MATNLAGRVIVVDDEEGIRTTVLAILESVNLSATGFGTAGDAVAAAAVLRPALALIDYHLPDMSGLDLAIALKEIDPEMRVILITGHASMESAIESVGKVDEYLVKPVQPPTLIRSVLNAIERYSLQAENRNLVERLQRLTSYQALYDPLTSLPNRVLLTDRLHEALSGVAGLRQWTAVYFIDIDGFKVINDSLGHAAGDQLLRQVAERLSDGLTGTQTVARFGGDKFVLVHPDITTAEEPSAKAEELLHAFDEPFVAGETFHRVSASIGVALAGGSEETNPDVLVRNADIAMYDAKAQGRARWRLYDASMRDRVVERLDIERGVREAMDAGHLGLVYQPIIELATGRVVGAEALLRWYRPGHGTVSPGRFLPVAEEAGLGPGIGRWVIEHALSELAAWHRAGLATGSFRLWLNVSPYQMADPELPSVVSDGLRHHGLPASMLGLEVIEDALSDVGVTTAVLTALRRLGVSLNLDDFGAGHSNLAWLQELPITGLKIDRRFINELDLGTDHKGALIVRGLIQLGHALGLTLLGEGVEREAQARLLGELGCELAQGFYFRHPVPSAELFEALPEPLG